jgi:phosphatidate cytidylyltransferase
MSDLFKAASLKQRVITAVIVAAVFITVVMCFPIFYFQLAMLLLFLVAAWEWANLAGFINRWSKAAYAVFMLLLVCVLQVTTQLVFLPLHLFTEPKFLYLIWIEWLMVVAVLFWSFMFLLITTYPRCAILFASRMVRALMGVLVLVPTWAAVVFLKQQHEAGGLILLVVAMIACADIGAYFAGVRFGKHKLAASVSPGKSWEGVVGGILCNVLLVAILAVYWHLVIDEVIILFWVMLAVVAFSIIGDLFESMMKRQRGIKDSGSILPGHGGILDRVDGWMAAVPVFTLAYLVFSA